jgi:intracellular sulfur oxidation DsrE/DsrF family protein
LSESRVFLFEDLAMKASFATALVVVTMSGWACAQTPAVSKLIYPIIPNVGGVVALRHAAEQPRKGAKVVLDITADAKADDVNKGLERAARLLNLYGAAGLKASDVKIALVMHGEATKSALAHAAYKNKVKAEKNPNLGVIADLRKAGAEVFVCGQALAYKGFKESEVADGIKVAVAAATVTINRQADGYSYIPAP